MELKLYDILCEGYNEDENNIEVALGHGLHAIQWISSKMFNNK